MTSAVGGVEGVPKKQAKRTKSADLDSDKEGGGPKNPKLLRTSYMEVHYGKFHPDSKNSFCNNQTPCRKVIFVEPE